MPEISDAWWLYVGIAIASIGAGFAVSAARAGRRDDTLRDQDVNRRIGRADRGISGIRRETPEQQKLLSPPMMRPPRKTMMPLACAFDPSCMMIRLEYKLTLTFDIPRLPATK
ncbi:hypothetical protein ACE103_29890 [Bradyrhizobium sp. ma5]|uniref:hypothetical protein n=1 Tax=Bradyrhizobium sp. ma5 TaxID=3344828 RepID=UPI0035D50271